MEKIDLIRKEFEEKYTMGSYEKNIWEFFEEKMKTLVHKDNKIDEMHIKS
ncbi:MAG: hypothetical protein ACNS62_02185 [Candidatus Cyclobacteriaceae bacterium M3_2C_046]